MSSETPPAHDSRIAARTGAQNNDPDYTRIGAIRIMLPGHHDASHRIDAAIALDGIVEQLCERISALDALEFLTSPGALQQEHVLVGYTNDRNHEAARERALGNAGKSVTAYGETTDAAPTTTGKAPSRIAERMQEIVDTETPGNIGVQVTEADLSPLGTLPRPTSRLLLPENIELTRIEAVPESGLVEIVETLNDRGVPYLFSAMVLPAGDRKSHDYLGTVRLVVFGTDNGILTQADIDTYSTTVEADFRLNSYFKAGMDNFELPVAAHTHYATNTTTYPTAVEEMDELSIRQSTIADLKSGFPEYESLLAGRINADQRYRELFDCYGVLRLRSCDLLQFFAIVPDYFDHSLWGRSATANPIQFTVEGFGSIVEGTRQQYGTEHPGDTQTPLETTNEESPTHQEDVSDWVGNLIRQGHEIIAIDQSAVDVDFSELETVAEQDPTTTSFFEDESRPDIVSRYNGQIYCHEIEIANDTKPAKLLVNLARGAYHGYPVIVITHSKQSARSKYLNENDAERAGPIREPYRDVDTEGVICYNIDAEIHPDEDVTILLPRGVRETRWRRTPADTHQLIDEEGTVLAEGPAEKSVDTYTYHTPRVREVGTSYVLVSASGDTIREQPTESAAIGDLVKARKPFPITQFMYLTNTTVKYRSGDEFREFVYQPEWALTYQDANARRYEEAVKMFIESVTVEKEDAEISLQVLRQRFLEWYGALTDLSQPNETWFGRAVQATYEVDDSNTRNKTLVGRTFRFTEGVLSPDLPFVTAADEESER